MNEDSQGRVHLYEGDGKGKTTAAIGLCVRMAGAGKRVLFAQFLKGRDTSELGPLRQLGVTVLRTDPVLKFLGEMNEAEREECFRACRGLFQTVCQALREGAYDLVVLDEVLDAVGCGILDEAALCQALQERRKNVEVALTGRGPGERLCELADYHSEIRAVKHPYDRGIPARRGIEF